MGIFSSLKDKYVVHTDRLLINEVRLNNRCPFCKERDFFSTQAVEDGEMFYCQACGQSFTAYNK